MSGLGMFSSSEDPYDEGIAALVHATVGAETDTVE